jgi:hypothetical protein
MPDLEPQPEDAAIAAADAVAADPRITAENRRIAAVVLAALVGATVVALVAGQAFADRGGCGEPGSGNVAPVVLVAGDASART